MSVFSGFEEPKENWSKLPHAFVNALPLVETEGELKVILYILRHTWGFQDKEKKITLDEFRSGRRRKDRTRLDAGTGLSKPTIIDGLERAEQHGFITVEVDDSDKARVKKLYSLRMSKDFTPDVKNLDTECKEPLQRSEKETKERNPSKILAGAKPPTPAQAMFTALAGVCRINMKLLSDIQRKQLNQSGKILRKEGIGPPDIQAFGDWWFTVDWRGKDNQSPRPHQVREEWDEFIAWKDGTDGTSGNSSGAYGPGHFATGIGEPFTEADLADE